DELLEERKSAASWPRMARRRHEQAIAGVQDAAGYAQRSARRRPNLTTGIAGVLVTKLLADPIPEFSEHEQLVLNALRRGNNSLTDKSDEELAAYVQALAPAQLQGLTSQLI